MNDYFTKPVKEEKPESTGDTGNTAHETTALPAHDRELSNSGTSLPLGAPPRSAEIPAPITTAMADEAAVDMKRLSKLTRGDEAKILELVDLYIAQSDSMLVVLGNKIQAGEVELVKNTAHKWGGSSSTCGMVGLAPILRDLEQKAREGSLATAPELYAQISAEYERVRAALDRYKNASAPG
jgi:HPt (histidine-containing phosphotransfer) domain-containing protein